MNFLATFLWNLLTSIIKCLNLSITRNIYIYIYIYIKATYELSNWLFVECAFSLQLWRCLNLIKKGKTTKLIFYCFYCNYISSIKSRLFYRLQTNFGFPIRSSLMYYNLTDIRHLSELVKIYSVLPCTFDDGKHDINKTQNKCT